MNEARKEVALPAHRAEIAAQALRNATQQESMANYPAIYVGFIERGIPADEIKPRINVLTYNAWLAVGRQVRKGEKGVRVVTFVTAKGKEVEEGGDAQSAAFKFSRGVSVFHISQTDPIEPKA